MEGSDVHWGRVDSGQIWGRDQEVGRIVRVGDWVADFWKALQLSRQ